MNTDAQNPPTEMTREGRLPVTAFRTFVAQRARHRTFVQLKVPYKIPKGFHPDLAKEPVALKRGDERLRRRQEGLAHSPVIANPN